MAERHGTNRAPGEPLPHARRFFSGELLPLLGQEAAQSAELAPDDAEHAAGRTIRRVKAEPNLATVYIIFTDRTYLTFASRLDEEGLILLDRFCPPAANYGDYWVFDELDGEIAAPAPFDAPKRATPFHPAGWRKAERRTVSGIGWYEEGMQVFIHLEGGGYLTFAARAHAHTAYLLGLFVDEEPASDDDYFIFMDQPAPAMGGS